MLEYCLASLLVLITCKFSVHQNFDFMSPQHLTRTLRSAGNAALRAIFILATFQVSSTFSAGFAKSAQRRADSFGMPVCASNFLPNSFCFESANRQFTLFSFRFFTITSARQTRGCHSRALCRTQKFHFLCAPHRHSSYFEDTSLAPSNI